MDWNDVQGALLCPAEWWQLGPIRLGECSARAMNQCWATPNIIIKRRQSQSDKFKEFAKISIFWILKQLLHVTHLLKLLDKMCTYEMDPMSIVEDTERTRFCPQTDRRTSIPPFQLRWSGGIINFGTTLHDVCLTPFIPCLLMLWRL